MRLSRHKTSLLSLAVLTALSSPVLAQVKVDGAIDPAEWQGARHVTDFRMVQPFTQAATRHPTEAWILATPDGLAVSHFDFYRFNDPQEWEDAGFRDLFAAPGLKLAEWPDKAAGLLPVADWVLRIQPGAGEVRHVEILAPTDRGARLLQDMPL